MLALQYILRQIDARAFGMGLMPIQNNPEWIAKMRIREIDSGYCLDAPSVIPAGSTRRRVSSSTLATGIHAWPDHMVR